MTSVEQINYTGHVSLKIRRKYPQLNGRLEQQNKRTLGNKATCVVAREENATKIEGEKGTEPYSVNWK